MTSAREPDLSNPEGQDVNIELQELVLLSSHKGYDLYRVTCRLKQAISELSVVLDVKDDCVFAGEVAPLIKHSLHAAFAEIADATFSPLADDAHERPKTEKPRWRFAFQALRRGMRNAFEVEFRFAGPKKAGGQILVTSSCIDEAWRAVPLARRLIHNICHRARVQTRPWKLTYEQLEDL